MTPSSDSLDMLKSYCVRATGISTKVSWHDKRQENQRRRKRKNDEEGGDAFDLDLLQQQAQEGDEGDEHIDFLA